MVRILNKKEARELNKEGSLPPSLPGSVSLPQSPSPSLLELQIRSYTCYALMDSPHSEVKNVTASSSCHAGL